MNGYNGIFQNPNASSNQYTYTQFTHSNSININTQEVHLTGQPRNGSPNGGRKPQTKIKIEEIRSMRQEGDGHEIIADLNELVEGYQN